MGERLSSVFSADGTLISASAAPHCGRERAKRKHLNLPFKNQVNSTQSCPSFQEEVPQEPHCVRWGADGDAVKKERGKKKI